MFKQLEYISARIVEKVETVDFFHQRINKLMTQAHIDERSLINANILLDNFAEELNILISIQGVLESLTETNTVVKNNILNDKVTKLRVSKIDSEGNEVEVLAVVTDEVETASDNIVVILTPKYD